jgi:uncharacterized membrane protein YciS (DUF1049 family)
MLAYKTPHQSDEAATIAGMMRKPQFSLAGLLALMLIAALLIGWLTTVWRREQEAKEEAKQRLRDAAANWVERFKEDDP